MNLKPCPWVSVRKQMPEENADILFVIDGDSGRYVKRGMRCWDGSYWWWCDQDGDYDEEGNDGDSSFVSHWMPTPKAPRKRTSRRVPNEPSK